MLHMIILFNYWIEKQFNVSQCKQQAKASEYLKYRTFCIQGRPKLGHRYQNTGCPERYGM